MNDATFRRRMRELRRGIERVAQRARARSRGEQGVNVARRTNVVVAANAADAGSIEAVSATQTAPIRQTGPGARDEDGIGESTS